MATEKEVYTLKPKPLRYGLFTGLIIAVLALVTVFVFQSWFFSDSSETVTQSPRVTLITDPAPFRAIVADHTVTPAQAQTDQQYFERLLTIAPPLTPSPPLNGVIIEGEGIDLGSPSEDEMSSSYKLNPYLVSILGYNYETFDTSIVADDFYQRALQLHDELLVLAALTNNDRRLLATERLKSDAPFLLPYPNALQTTFPSSHVLLLFLLRDLVLHYEAEFFRPVDPAQKLATAEQELKDAIDEGIRLRLYTLSDVIVSEAFYYEFIRTLRQNNSIPASWPVENNLFRQNVIQ